MLERLRHPAGAAASLISRAVELTLQPSFRYRCAYAAPREGRKVRAGGSGASRAQASQRAAADLRRQLRALDQKVRASVHSTHANYSAH